MVINRLFCLSSFAISFYCLGLLGNRYIPIIQLDKNVAFYKDVIKLLYIYNFYYFLCNLQSWMF